MSKKEPLGLKRIEALHYYVNDLERSRRFYTERLDFKEIAVSGEALNERAVLSQPLYPMIRGRITHINDEALGPGEDHEDGRREREMNLTWSNEIPPGNELIDGDWWEPDTPEALISVEQGMAERMQLSVGDVMTYDIGSRKLEVTVASIRSLDWESMQPNFFVVLPPAVLQGYPATFMTSFHLDRADKQFLNGFITRQFERFRIFDVSITTELHRTQ